MPALVQGVLMPLWFNSSAARFYECDRYARYRPIERWGRVAYLLTSYQPQCQHQYQLPVSLEKALKFGFTVPANLT